MKRVIVVDENKCPYQIHVVDFETGKDIKDAKIECAKRLLKKRDKSCCDENCPYATLPKELEIKESDDMDSKTIYDNALKRGFNICLDWITKGKS